MAASANVFARPHPLNGAYQHLQISVSRDNPHVTIVSLDRPHKRNAINAIAWKEIGRIFSQLARLGDGCRCVLLTGNGSAFCAGIDIMDPSFTPTVTDTDDIAHTGLTFSAKLKDMQDAFTALEICPVPVVAAVHGKCIGAGIDLICAADVRWCHPDTVFSVREVTIGLAADVGTLQRLPKICGNQSTVRELCFTGRDFNAAESLQIGLVSRVTENLVTDALELCSTIASHSPIAVQGTKKALLYARDHSVTDGLDQIGAFNALALQSNDLATAFAAITSREAPIYADIPAHSRL
jgi:Delta3,5-Delta2,4-dienoyl-CoA isomerase